jgi:hypothetical protein
MRPIFIIAVSSQHAGEVARMFGLPPARWDRLASDRASVGLSYPKVLDAWRPRFPTEAQLATYANILRNLNRSKADRIVVPEGTAYRVGDTDRHTINRILASGRPDAFEAAFDAIRDMVKRPSPHIEDDDE